MFFLLERQACTHLKTHAVTCISFAKEEKRLREMSGSRGMTAVRKQISLHLKVDRSGTPATLAILMVVA